MVFRDERLVRLGAVLACVVEPQKSFGDEKHLVVPGARLGHVCTRLKRLWREEA